MPGLRMPSPARTVRRSVGICQRMGMSRTDALTVVIACCNAVIARSQLIPGTDCTWAAEVRSEAEQCLYTRPTLTLRDWIQ
jgi:hypothetical protein